MRFISTRGLAPEASFVEAALQGLADDKGLFVPKKFWTFAPDGLESMRYMRYDQIAEHIFRASVGDEFGEMELRSLARTFNPKEFGGTLAPVVHMHGNMHILDLSTGRTGAFKDYGMKWLGTLYPHLLKKLGKVLVIVGSTSGDTGGAAEEALRGQKNMIIVMLYPHTGMSEVQQNMMNRIQDANIINIALRARFDTCQSFMKRLTLDPDMRALCDNSVGNINSTTWPRPMAQVPYYFAAYFQVSKPGQKIAFSVPTGNFGDIYAGWVAIQMGLPVSRLYLATNENNVLADIWSMGIYRPRKDSEVVVTSSNSMDIANASNFERLLFEAVHRDPAVIRTLWERLGNDGHFDLHAIERGEEYLATLRQWIIAGTSRTAERHKMISTVFKNDGLIIEPHTADGIVVGEMLHRQHGSGEPLVCLQTAAPWKFPDVVCEATGLVPQLPEKYQGLDALPKREIVLDADFNTVKTRVMQEVRQLLAA